MAGFGGRRVKGEMARWDGELREWVEGVSDCEKCGSMTGVGVCGVHLRGFRVVVEAKGRENEGISLVCVSWALLLGRY